MGPGDPITSRNSRADAIRGEKGGARFEASMPYPILAPRSAPLRALPQILYPAESANGRSVCQMRDSLRSIARKSAKSKRSLDEEKEWIESTEEKLFTINRENFLVQKQHTTSMQKLIGNNINSFITQASIHSGANDGVMYLG